MNRIIPILALVLAAVPFSSFAVSDLAAIKQQFRRPESIPFPEYNQYSPAKADLGAKLFFDPRLSGSGKISCATCHNPALSWTDGLALGRGHNNQVLDRKTPSILNLAWDELFFWDGRAESLEDQALGPIASEKEMHMPLDNLVKVLQKIAGYKPLFAAAFPEQPEVNLNNIAKAIATYERLIVSPDSPFDDWIAGNPQAISAKAQRGFKLFTGKANCVSCHSGWNFSDSSFHDIGMPDKDHGRGELLPGLEMMDHAFKTVGLRDIAKHPPYMHDGSLKTLTEVVEHYNSGGVVRPSRSAEIEDINLSAAEISDLVAFLESLSGPTQTIKSPVLPK